MLRFTAVFLLCLFSLSLQAQQKNSVTRDPDLNQEKFFYTLPGVATYKEGSWVGNVHLYNLQNTLGIYVEIVKPEEVVIEFTDEDMRNIVSTIFEKADIQVVDPKSGAKSALPFFHLLIMVTPHLNSYFSLVTGRLFESIKLGRVELASGIHFQAITWEEQILLISPKGTLKDEIEKATDKIANKFTERYRFFINLKRQIEK